MVQNQFSTSYMVGTLDQIVEAADNVQLIEYLEQHNPGPEQLFYHAQAHNKLDVFNSVYSSLIIWAMDEEYSSKEAALYLNSEQSNKYIENSLPMLLTNPVEASQVLHQIVEFSGEFPQFDIKIREIFAKISFPDLNQVSIKQRLLRPLELRTCPKCQSLTYRDHVCDENEGTLRVLFRENDMRAVK